MATIGTLLHTWLNGTQVGTDASGNRYFESKKADSEGRKKRWVLYHGAPEPTKIPAEWHGWMHYTTDILPSDETVPHHRWIKPSRPNPTGTPERHLPPGHLLQGAHRPYTASADYTPWEPTK
jgi:NADH:ubiquinone oxidoreductase subunit